MSLLIECWHKAKTSEHKGLQKIIESVKELEELLTSDTTSAMKLDDMVFQFIEKNPGTTTTEIQNNFLEYNQTQKIQCGPNGVSSTDCVSFSLETLRRAAKISCDNNRWHEQKYLENKKSEQFIAEHKVSDLQNKMEEEQGFGSDSITIGGDD